MLARLLAATIVGAIIVLECTLTYFLLPSPQALSDAVEKDAAAAALASRSGVPGDAQEMSLGKFTVTKSRPEHNSTLRIEFHLVYTVLKEDRREFSGLLATHTNRLRDRVIIIVRNSDVSDLTDPGLDLIKRRILETSNNLFGRSIVQSVVFSDYSLVEQ